MSNTNTALVVLAFLFMGCTDGSDPAQPSSTGGSTSDGGTAGSKAGSSGSAGSANSPSQGGSGGDSGSGSSGSSGDAGSGGSDGGSAGNSAGTAGIAGSAGTSCTDTISGCTGGTAGTSAGTAGTGSTGGSTTGGTGGSTGSSGSGGSGGSGGTGGSGGSAGSGGNTAGMAGSGGSGGSVAGSGGSGGNTAGTAGSSGTAGSAGTSGTAGSSGSSGSSGMPNLPFSCEHTWANGRDAAFDALSINGISLDHPGGMYGTSANDIRVSVHTSVEGGVAVYDGLNWTIESLPQHVSDVGGISGSGTNNIWLAAHDDEKGLLFHRVNNNWVVDPNQPSALEFIDIDVLDSTHAALLGAKASGYLLWKKSGTAWSLLLTSPDWTVLSRVWMFDANNIFVTGYHTNANGIADAARLYHCDSSSCSLVSLPADLREAMEINGQSLDDLWLTGRLLNGQGIVYHLVNTMTTMVPYPNPNMGGYGPVRSKYPGTVLVAGGAATGGQNVKLTTIDQMTAPDNIDVDDKAFGPVDIFFDPNSSQTMFVNGSYGGIHAGFYRGFCSVQSP